jgi:LmbE family N-acetylglucosaminyl deacetylase/tetratricopeptide (TPR) repeat protein
VEDAAAVILAAATLAVALAAGSAPRASPVAADLVPPVAAAGADGDDRAVALRDEEARRFPSAMGAWERVLAAHPGDVQAIAHLARLSSWTGDLDRAVVRYRDALALRPRSHGLRSDLADVLAWMQRFDDAEREYEAVLADDPTHHEALKGLARLRLLRGDLAGAAPIIERGLAHYPGDGDLHRARGRLLATRGDLPGAADSLRRAVALEPADPEAAQALGEVLFRAGDYRAALEAYGRAATLQPGSAHHHVQMARIHVALGHAVRAQEEVAAALRLSPLDPDAAEIDRSLRKAAAVLPIRSVGDALELATYGALLPIVLGVAWRMRRTLRRRPGLRAFAWYVVPGFVVLNIVLHLAKQPLARYVDEALVESLSEVVLFLGVGAGFLAAVRSEPRAPELRGQTVLVLGAHPDDIELGTAGFLLKLKDSGAKVFGLTLSGGEVGGDPARRRDEAQRALRFVGLDGYEILGFPDTRLGESIPALRAAIEERVRRLGATLVLTHSAVDVHGDHRAVHEATREAARGVPTVLCYEDVSTPQGFEPNYFVDVSGYVDDHVRAIAFHRSQAHRTYMDPEMVRGRAAHRGLQMGASYALAFRALSIVR